MISDSFSEHEKALENKFALDEKLNFEIHAKAAKLFGLWAATQFGMAQKDAEAYAGKIREMDVESPKSIVFKVHDDFKARGIKMTERLLYNQFNAKLQQSRRDSLAERLR